MICLLPRGRFERWSWQTPFVAILSQCFQFQCLTANVSRITPAKRVENQGSPLLVSGNSSAPVHALWLFKCPCYVSLCRTQVRNLGSIATDGHQASDDNYVILTKRGKIRPIFTPFRRIDHFRVKYACYLHHFLILTQSAFM